jgi:CheY-like chemotaxis protein
LVPSDIKKGRPRAEKCKARVLVVDDEVINQKIISSMLKSDGYEVQVASDGVIALMQIAKEKFDLVLSDISMPNLDGYQLLEYIKSNKIDIPVIFLSGHTGPEFETKGLKMGAAEYIGKPVNRNLLLLKMERILSSTH